MKIRNSLAKLLVVAAGVAVMGTGSIVSAQDTIQKGVTINGTDVSGMTYAEAEAVVKQKVADDFVSAGSSGAILVG